MSGAVYDSLAKWYSDSLDSGSPVHAIAMPALLELAGPVEGLFLCDLACGTGVAARALAERGAHVVGIDLSRELLEIAASRPGHGVEYLQGDIQRLQEIATDRFDGAVCSLALMDILDLQSALKEAARVVRRGGWLAFTITHPCFQGPESRWTGKAGGTVKREVRGYFREGHWISANPNGVRGKAGAYHRTLSTYLNTLLACGWQIETVREPAPQDEVAARVPGYAEAPVLLAIRCRCGG